jgi:predicted phosphodiesterase
MKQVLVFADSHRDLASMQKAIAYHKNIRTVIHCGDHYSDAMQLVRPGYEWYAVKGNCDAYNSDEEYDFVLNEDKAHPILITHGDKYAVKWSFDSLPQKRVKSALAPPCSGIPTGRCAPINRACCFLIPEAFPFTEPTILLTVSCP